MASSGQAITASFYAFIAATNLPKTGDSANMKAFLLKDGTVAVPAAAVAEIDAVKAPGSYKVTLTGAENTGGFMVVGGTTSTAGVVILPSDWTNENLPIPAPGAANGILIAGTNAPVTITGSGTALTLTSTGANGSGLQVTGNGNGAGIAANGGATGDGMVLTSATADPLAFTVPEASGVPSATDTFMKKFEWLTTLARNKITCSASAETVFADDGTTSIGTAAVGDTGAVGTRGQFG